MGAPVLVGDVGGTSARFALAEQAADGAIALSAFRKQANSEYDSFVDSLGGYLETLGERPEKALFALAGPVALDGSVKLSNRNWPVVTPQEIRAAHGHESVRLVNDFAAMARAVPEMADDAFETILEGDSSPLSPTLVTGPGTGFGIATLIPREPEGYDVLTGEGGHAAYAAHTVREAELAERLMAEHGYVSTEMVVGGAWLQPVFDMLSDLHGVPRRAMAAADIMASAEAGEPVCREVCELRARSIMGAVGDGVLMNGARGGAVLTGGVAERMIDWLKAPEATNRFYDRGGHAAYMANIPVRVMTSPHAPLVGAAALLLDSSTPPEA